MIHVPPGVALAMLVLLVASVATSAVETALFSLSPAERRRGGPRVEALLADERALLVTVLCLNLMVNIGIYALSAEIQVGDEAWKRWTRDVLVLLVVLCIGEVLPKALALRLRTLIVPYAIVPMTMCVRLMRPVQRWFDFAIRLIDRAIGESGHEESGIRPQELELALQKSAERGVLLDSEAETLAGVVELEAVRVREIMTPRVDMLMLDRQRADNAEPIAKAIAGKTPWLVVIEGDPDHVVGRVRLRDLLKHPNRPPDEFLAPVKFVPEVASALDTLHDLREAHVAEAVVVDEWGGTAGLVTLEDIFEQIVGDLRIEGETIDRAVVPLADGVYRVNGRLSIREWNEYFGRRVVPTEFETVSGLVTALLGRIPVVGDVVRAGGLVLTVHSVAQRRVREVDIRVDSSAAAPREVDAR